MPADDVRDVPDVSLSASNYNDPFIVCTPLSEVGKTGSTSTCATNIQTALETYNSAFGGTSASTPLMAGITALMNQYLNGSSTAGLGNINPMLYSLAASSPSAFHDTPAGSNSIVDCTAGDPAGQPTDVVCPSAGTFGFDTTAGYDVVTGLGSVDANALAVAWKASLTPTGDFTLTVTSDLSPSSVSAGQSAAATLTIAPVNGSTQTINFSSTSCTGQSTGATCSFNPTSVTLDGTDSQTVQLTVSTLPNMALGAETITVTGTASGTGGTSQTATVDLTVIATTETFGLSAPNATYPVTVGGKASVAVSVNSTTGFIVGSGAGATTALPLTYTCSGSSAGGLTLAAAEISCQISPGSSQPTNATMVTVTLQTTAPTTQLRPLLGGGRILYALLLPGLFGVVCLGGSRTRGLRLLSLIVVLSFSTLGLGSCGGGGGTNTTPTNPGTPSNTYVVTISATTGGANPVTNANPPFTFNLVVGN